ncbi:universal stress protein [Amylibacter cionae]|nr:universal stress protein [Amylibacter cionae]
MNTSQKREKTMFTTIVAAVDGSEPSKHAIKAACDIAGHYGAELHLVHTPQVDTTAVAVGAGTYVLEASFEQIAEAGRAVMAEAKTACESYGIEPKSTYIGSGIPADEVLSVATAKDADLIVCGRRGLGNLAAIFLGSTSSKITHDATCAVLTVK